MSELASETDTLTYDAIANWLVERLAVLTHVEVNQIDVDQPFVDFNLDSSISVAITKEFSQWLDRELPITAFWEYPTIRLLSEVLASGEDIN